MTSSSFTGKAAMRISRVSRLWQERQGAAVVEFGLMLPLLLILALGVSEMGRALSHYHVVSKSVRDAARYLARVQVNCSGAGSGTFGKDSASGQQVLSRAYRLALYGVDSTQGPPLLPYWTDAEGTIAVEPTCVDNASGAYRGFDQLRVIRVRATVPYADLGFLSFLGVDDIVLVAEHQEFGVGE